MYRKTTCSNLAGECKQDTRDNQTKECKDTVPDLLQSCQKSAIDLDGGGRHEVIVADQATLLDHRPREAHAKWCKAAPNHPSKRAS